MTRHHHKATAPAAEVVDGRIRARITPAVADALRMFAGYDRDRCLNVALYGANGWVHGTRTAVENFAAELEQRAPSFISRTQKALERAAAAIRAGLAQIDAAQGIAGEALAEGQAAQ